MSSIILFLFSWFLYFLKKRTEKFWQSPKMCYLCRRKRAKLPMKWATILGYGVMVTLQILVLSFLVRVRVSQQKAKAEWFSPFSFFVFWTFRLQRLCIGLFWDQQTAKTCVRKWNGSPRCSHKIEAPKWLNAIGITLFLCAKNYSSIAWNSQFHSLEHTVP